MDSHLISYTLNVFTGFFAIMNPIVLIPIFLALVEGKSKLSKKRIAKKATFTAFLIVLAFTVLGNYIFAIFDITIPAFKITGGIIIFFVGFEMLQSKKSSIHSHSDEETADEGDEDIAISPLAIPLLAGPGTIVTAMNNVTHGKYIHIVIVIVAFAIMAYLTYLAFSASDLIVEKLGTNLITVLGKIMGLILAIMATGMVIEGIKIAFHLA